MTILLVPTSNAAISQTVLITAIAIVTAIAKVLYRMIILWQYYR